LRSLSQVESLGIPEAQRG